MGFGFEILIISLMLVFNAFFAAYEMALASVSRSRLAVLAEEKKPGAKAAFYMKGRMEASLAVVQLGITLVGAIAAATGGAGVQDSLVPLLQERWDLSENTAEAIAVLILVIPLSAVTIVFAELVPKVFAIQNNEWVCLKLSPVMKLMALVAYPVIALFEWSVKSLVRLGSRLRGEKKAEEKMGLKELKMAAGTARASRLISPREEKIVVSASQLSNRPVRSVLLPAEDIVMIPLDSTLSDALVRAHRDMHTRFPVCGREGDPQSIQGYVNFKDIVVTLKINPSDPTIRGILRNILSVDATDSLSKVLEKMIQERIHIAVVKGTSGKIKGLVTLEDILEEMVGEIEDEYDRLPAHLHPYLAGWIAGGGVKMSALARLANLPWNEEKDLSLADWSVEFLGRRPKSGEVISSKGLEIQIRKLRRKKVAEAAVRRVPDPQ